MTNFTAIGVLDRGDLGTFGFFLVFSFLRSAVERFRDAPRQSATQSVCLMGYDAERRNQPPSSVSVTGYRDNLTYDGPPPDD